MSQKTRAEVLAKKRDRYARAGKEHKTKIINEVVELFDCHRKAATWNESAPASPANSANVC